MELVINELEIVEESSCACSGMVYINTMTENKTKFNTEEDAIAYAESQGWKFDRICQVYREAVLKVSDTARYECRVVKRGGFWILEAA